MIEGCRDDSPLFFSCLYVFGRWLLGDNGLLVCEPWLFLNLLTRVSRFKLYYI